MSGHSKWSTIKRKKEATDSARAKIFTKIGREITVCVKEGGPDPSTNSKLRDLIAKAKSNNVPNDNIDRVIKKATGDGDKNDYISIVYEGYGPNGVAVIVETLTDNKNRTAADVRHYFDKFGGNLGTSGCVSFMFSSKGIIVAANNSYDEDKVMEDCVESGADDFSIDGDTVEFVCSPSDLNSVKDALAGLKYDIVSYEVEKVPDNYIKLTDEEAVKKMELLLEHLEDNDDIQNVWHNWECEED
ncbi:MAG: YebC/PmpR family DNA-binding transcriptional regulator [Oscillospiraceae bacterium]|nr:YebC/PmpR family DNA-binding transcriptional regulator [Oscillospiraceae bacterium]